MTSEPETKNNELIAMTDNDAASILSKKLMKIMKIMIGSVFIVFIILFTELVCM